MLLQEYSSTRSLDQNSYLRWIYRKVMYELGYSDPNALHEELLNVYSSFCWHVTRDGWVQGPKRTSDMTKLEMSDYTNWLLWYLNETFSITIEEETDLIYKQ